MGDGGRRAPRAHGLQTWTNQLLPYMDSIPKIEHTAGEWASDVDQVDERRLYERPAEPDEQGLTLTLIGLYERPAEPDEQGN